MKINTPLLLIVFNRPDTTKQVFEAIRQARPAKLYIAADGPRPEKEGEEEIVQEVRSIATNVDWDCEVNTLFRDQNLGCKMAVSSAITWFFDHEEEGIIIEDDCLPTQSFFRFCEEMLSTYRNDERIMMVSGTNYLFNKVTSDDDYFFSRYFSIWGWGTWKRAWDCYDISMRKWPHYKKIRYLESVFSEKDIVKFYYTIFDKAYTNKVETWDLQWVYTCIFNNGLSVVPVLNQVSNIGVEGTHGNKEHNENSIFIKMPTQEVHHRIKKMNTEVYADPELDRLTFDNIGITKREKRWIKKIFTPPY